MAIEYFGAGSLSQVRELVESLKVQRVFLVTGKQSFSSSGAQKKLDNLLKDRQVVVFNAFSANPKLEDVISGSKLLKNSSPDLILAVGGGSVLDMAKLVNISAANNGIGFHDIVENSGLISNKGLPMVAISTTAGSGSQATHFAVVYIGKCKHSVAHNYLLPDYLIVDQELCYHTPKKIAASSAMDALSQAVESYWSIYANSESRQYATRAIGLILESIDLAINKNDKESIGNLSLAAHFSGKAINITKTTAPHAISYTLTSNFGVPHGHAVAALLIQVVLVSIEKKSDRYVKILDEVIDLFGCNSLEEFESMWKSVMSKCGLSSNMQEFGVTIEDTDFIVKGVNLERLTGHPVSLNREDLTKIVKRVLLS